MVYTLDMTELIRRRKYANLTTGDIVKCSKAVHGSHGRKYTFLSADFADEKAEKPLWLNLVDIRSGGARSVKPEHVTKQVADSKAAQARIAKKEAAAAEAAKAREARKAEK